MSNSQQNFISLKVLEKKNINSPKASHEVTVAEITKGCGQFRDGYIVIASVEEGSAIKNSIVSIPSNGIMAVVGASLADYS